MGDKITNFSDYKKRGNSVGREIQEDTPKDLFETTEINNIEIEDPYSFFTAEEREEYLREQAKKDTGEQNEKVWKDQDSEKEERPVKKIQRPEPEEDDEDFDEEEYDEDYDEDEEYDDEEDEEEEDDDESSGGITPEFLVRVASIITGVFILAMIVFGVKVKIIDKYLKDPDEQQTVVTAIPDGYRETNDTVTTTTDLNLRSVPSSAEKTTIKAVAPKGTSLKRIAVSEDGSWALVEYEGQQLYGSMKYLSTP